MKGIERFNPRRPDKLLGVSEDQWGYRDKFPITTILSHAREDYGEILFGQFTRCAPSTQR